MTPRNRIYDAVWRALLAGHRGMETRVRTMAKRNLGVLLLLSAAWPWAGPWPLVVYLFLSVAMAGHRTVRYVATWSFRRHVHEPVATVLDNIIRPRTPSGQGLVHLAIPRDFRDNDGTDIRVHVPMDWPATKEDMTAVARALEQRLATEPLSARWTLTGRKPHGVFVMPSRPPVSADMVAMLEPADAVAAEKLLMGPGARGQLVTFDLAMESPHLAIAAASGAGKSELLAWVVGQFMRRGYGVACLDAKFTSHMWLRRIPGVLYAAESEELHDALIWLDDELLRRARFVAAGGDPAKLVPLVVLMEEMNGASNRLRTYWRSIKGQGDPMMSPALTALANLSSMGRELRLHILMAGQSLTGKATGGVENRENFGGRALARATSNQWKMLAPQIRPIPRRTGEPGRWHLVVGDTLKEFQAPFVDIKRQVPRLIGWATGASPIPDVPAMMAGVSATTRNAQNSRPEAVDGVSLRDFAAGRGIGLTQLRNWRNAAGEDFPQPVMEGPNRTALYDPADLDLFVLTRTGG